MSTAVNPPPNGNDVSTSQRDSDVTRTDYAPAVPDRKEVVARQKEEFGGMKFGAAFFGWLAATGMAVLLTAIVAAAGTALGYTANVNTTDPTAGEVQTIGLVGAIALLAVIFIAYFCGGYVAGRMARFNGLRQGIAVWLWAVLAAIVAAVVAVGAGSSYDVLANLNLPRIPVTEGSLTTLGALTAIGIAAASLGGAILGGLAGMRFHRRVDRAGLG
jgi:amino acid transporter